VKRAILTHRRDFVAIAVLILAAIVVTGYILQHQPSFTFGQSYYTIDAEFSEASAVISGQGQPVTIAGVQVGKIGSISLRDGKAVVQMNIDKRYRRRVFRDATVLLRPRTPLKDMYLSLDPGTASAGRLPAGSTLGTGSTNPDVDVSEILSSLDADTRNYLLLLLSGGAQIFRDHGTTSTTPSSDAVANLRGTLKRFAPLDRDTESFASLLATRQSNLRRAVHNLNVVAGSLGSVDTQLASLVRSSDTNFTAISQNDAQLQDTLSEFPGTLRQADQTLGKVKGFATAAGTTLGQLEPFARNLGPALAAARPLFKDTTPVIANQLRPVSVSLQPLARTLAPAAKALNAATPALSGSVGQLSTLLNELAYEPGHGQQGYLFYGAWLAHLTDSLASNQDANGATVQGQLMGNCKDINFYQYTIEPGAPPLGAILDFANLPDVTKLPGVTVTPSPNPALEPQPTVTCPAN
jgi:phospholipid/cholesterol/gamma-HCH transport system substrate-binding protein